MFDYLLKMCVVGDSGIGKTAFVKSFMQKSYFDDEYPKDASNSPSV